jgi:hypothetical protein
MRRSKVVFLALMGLAVPGTAQEEYRHGRIRYLEPQVTLQRATETGAEEAVVNLPFLPGDRVWTDCGSTAGASSTMPRTTRDATGAWS